MPLTRKRATLKRAISDQTCGAKDGSDESRAAAPTANSQPEVGAVVANKKQKTNQHISLLPDLVWVWIKPNEKTKGRWWPAKILSKCREDRPLLIRRFGGSGKDEMEIENPSARNLRSFRDLAFRKTVLQSSERDNHKEFMKAYEEALEAEEEEDDGLPGIELALERATTFQRIPNKSKSSRKPPKFEKSLSMSCVPDESFFPTIPQANTKEISELLGDIPSIESVYNGCDVKVPGELVLAIWDSDKRFYPAIVEERTTSGKYRIRFYSNHKRTLAREKFYTMFEEGFQTCQLGDIDDLETDGSEIENAELEASINDILPELRSILAGKMPSWRLEEFRQGGKKAWSRLAQSVSQGQFSNQEYALVRRMLQYDLISSVPDQLSEVRQPVERAQLIDAVLVPEAIIRLLMREHDIDYTEAEERMLSESGDSRWAERILAARNAFLMGNERISERNGNK
ncbi:uncharacterized protein VTP21DRAFT_7579 [Calcarisporiella thermophila]|uniref:uncharacterized protein n=1 Tax=Calcarisporiella thermophila TaxID=911321 RepID=UPI003744AAB8